MDRGRGRGVGRDGRVDHRDRVEEVGRARDRHVGKEIVFTDGHVRDRDDRVRHDLEVHLFGEVGVSGLGFELRDYGVG